MQMAIVAVFGGTGYTGTNIVREAASRGHAVISVSRRKPKEPVEGVQYEVGSVEQLAPRVIAGADAVVPGGHGGTAGRGIPGAGAALGWGRRTLLPDRRLQFLATGAERAAFCGR